MKVLRVSLFALLGLIFLPSSIYAANPIHVAHAWANIKVKSIVWYFGCFRKLDTKERTVVIKTLKMLQSTVKAGLKITDKDNVTAHVLQGIPVVAHGYVLAKTWSPDKTDKIMNIAINPVYAIGLEAFADKYNLDVTLPYEKLIKSSGLSEHEAVYELYVLGLQAITTCLWWASW
jgi:hypothetical protein